MAGICVPHQHVGLVGVAGEIAEARDRPLQSNLPHRRRRGIVLLLMS